MHLPIGPAGHFDHPLGRTPRPPRSVWPNLHPQRPCKTLRPPPWQDSPSPHAGVPGSTSPQALEDTPINPWAEFPRPPRPVCPVQIPHGPFRTLRPPPGPDSPSPQGGVPGSISPQAPAGHSDHPLGRTPRPPRPVCPVLPPHRPCRTLCPPRGQDSPSPQAAMPESTSPQALEDTLTTPWAGLPVPLGRCARFYLPTGPAGHSDHLLGRTPRAPRLVCPDLRPHRPCRTLRPPRGQDSPSPQAGVPGVPLPTAPRQ